MRTVRTTLLCALMIAACLVASPARAAELFGVNVIRNPGGEEGTTGWTSSGGASVLPYGAPGTSSCFYSGAKHFVGLPSSGWSYLEQTVDLTAGSATIDRGGVGVRMIGRFGSSSSSWTSFSLEYLNASGVNMGFESVAGHYYSSCGGALGTNQFYEDIVPIGARTIRVRLYLPEGTWADDVSLTLVPPPFADLVTRASASSAWAYAKVPFKHTFSVENLGPDVATNANLFVTPPAGATVISAPGCYVSMTPPDPAAPSGYTCEMGRLEVGDGETFVFTLKAFKKGAYTTSAFTIDPDDRNAANSHVTVTTSIGGKYVI